MRKEVFGSWKPVTPRNISERSRSRAQHLNTRVPSPTLRRFVRRSLITNTFAVESLNRTATITLTLKISVDAFTSPVYLPFATRVATNPKILQVCHSLKSQVIRSHDRNTPPRATHWIFNRKARTCRHAKKLEKNMIGKLGGSLVGQHEPRQNDTFRTIDTPATALAHRTKILQNLSITSRHTMCLVLHTQNQNKTALVTVKSNCDEDLIFEIQWEFRFHRHALILLIKNHH